MYSDAGKKRWPLILAAAVIVLLAVLLWEPVTGLFGRNVTEEGAEAIAEAVRRSALQCYVVEGVYPPDLTYLEEHYGLRVNTDDYYVIYDAFASNLPPDVRVARRE